MGLASGAAAPAWADSVASLIAGGGGPYNAEESGAVSAADARLGKSFDVAAVALATLAGLIFLTRTGAAAGTAAAVVASRVAAELLSIESALCAHASVTTEL